MAQNDSNFIERFVAKARRRVNTHRFWNALIWGLVAGLALLTVTAIILVLQGYAVPRVAYAMSVTVAFVAAVGMWLFSRMNVDQSARFVDRFYQLHDAVASYLHFSRAQRRDGFYALQATSTQRQLASLSPQAIGYEPPRRGLMFAAGLVALSIPLGLRGPSDKVVEQQRVATATKAYTQAVKPELEELVDEVDKASNDPLERELINPEQLRKWVNELEATTDPKEALRELAQLERKLNAARLATQSRREEQLLEKAATELQAERETRPLGDALADKKYDQAAEKLDQLRPEESKSASEARKSMARLKAAAQRMAAAAKSSRAAASRSNTANKSEASKAGTKSNSGSSTAAATDGSNGSEGGGELSDELEKLESSVAELDQLLQQAEKQEKQNGQCDAKTASQCQACQKSVNSQIDSLSKRLGRLCVRRNAEKKLQSLCKACSQCQSGLCACTGQCASPKAGGTKAGWGSNTARREASDDLVDNGQTTQLQGIHGEGPSVSTVEEAEDGSGVATRRTEARERKFSRQIESFVQREDVPEQVKRGVKNYFQLIHQMEPQPAVKANDDE